MKRTAITLLLTLCLAGACSRKKPPPPDSDPIPLTVNDAELAQMKKRLSGELAANRTRRCPTAKQPSTSGKALNTNPAIEALTRPKGVLKQCATAMLELGKRLSAATLFSEKVPDGYTSRFLVYSRELPTVLTPVLQADLKRLKGICGGLSAAIRTALKSAQLCSPYLPGRLELPKSPDIMVPIQAHQILARFRARTNPTQSLHELLDGMEFSAALSQGGVPLAIATISLQISGMMHSAFELIASRTKLDAEQQRRLDGRLDQLIKNAPPLAQYYRGERLSVQQAQFKELQKGQISPSPAQLVGTWITLGEIFQRTSKITSQSTPLIVRLKALDRLFAGLSDPKAKGPNALLPIVTRAFTTPTFRQKMSEVVRQMIIPSNRRFADHYSRRLFYLGAFRLHLALRASSTIDDGRLTALLKQYPDPVTGKAFRLKRQKGVVWLTRSPLPGKPGGDPEPAYRIVFK